MSTREADGKEVQLHISVKENGTYSHFICAVRKKSS